jgi:hypothetical protein
MFKNNIERDERAVAVQRASFTLGYQLLTFALLIDIMYRSFVRGEAPWDLFAIIFLGGAVTTIYQARYRIFTRSWIKTAILVFAIDMAAAVIIGLTGVLR